MVDEGIYKIHTRNDVCEIELRKIMNYRECHIVRNKEGKVKIVDLEKYDIKITDKMGRSIEGSVIGNFDEDKLKSNDKKYIDAVCVDYFDDGMRLLKCMTENGGYLGELEKGEDGRYKLTSIEEVKNKYKGKNSITNTRYEREKQEQAAEQTETRVRRRRYNPENKVEEYIPKHVKEEEQEYIPKHAEKEEQEYIPKHAKKEEQEYIPKHAKKEETKEIRRRYDPKHSKDGEEKEI